MPQDDQSKPQKMPMQEKHFCQAIFNLSKFLLKLVVFRVYLMLKDTRFLFYFQYYYVLIVRMFLDPIDEV
jgi:hypothetical protein